MIGDKAIGAKPLGGGGNDELTSPPATGVDTVPLPQGNALVWNCQEDNFTWADAYVDKATPEAVVCMQYQFDPGWSVRWSDLTETWADLLDAGYHMDGTPVTLRMDVIGNSVKCYRDNELMITETVPDELVGSTIHGLSVDVNAAQPRQPNLPCAVAPYSWRAI